MGRAWSGSGLEPGPCCADMRYASFPRQPFEDRLQGASAGSTGDQGLPHGAAPPRAGLPGAAGP